MNRLKHKPSPYSKMFLVGPAVYDKMLNCLDEVDQKTTKDLNESYDINQPEKRPSEIALSELQNEELNNTEISMDVDMPENNSDPNISVDQNNAITKPPGIPDKSFTCDICQESFERPWKLKHHKLMIHQNEPGPVNKPITRSETQVEMNNSPNLLGGFICDICYTSFTNELKLKNHKIQIHNVSDEGDLVKTNIPQASTKQFTCSICLKSFDRNWGLKRHMESVHFNNENQLLKSENNVRNVTLMCEICSEFFDKPWKLKHHKLMIHSHANKKEPETVQSHENSFIKWGQNINDNRTKKRPFETDLMGDSFEAMKSRRIKPIATKRKFVSNIPFEDKKSKVQTISKNATKRKFIPTLPPIDHSKRIKINQKRTYTADPIEESTIYPRKRIMTSTDSFKSPAKRVFFNSWN